MEKTKILKKSIRLGALLLAFIICIAAFSSCSLLITRDTDKYMTEEEIEALLDGKLHGDVTIEAGDNYNVEIDAADSNVSAASKALLSVVSIRSVFEKNYTTGWGPNASVTTREVETAGSGVIYRLDKNAGDAYIITNYHVVYYNLANTANRISNKISVYLYGMEYSNYAIPATYVGGSMNYDLAVLKIEDSRILAESNAMVATFADSDETAVLDTAIAIGNPEGEGISATLGHVNVDSEQITMTGADGSSEIVLRVVRTDAAVNGGNSGGGLFNAKGELIGIVNAKMVTTSVDNIGYAIPSNVAKYVADNVIDYCDGTKLETVRKCMLGIEITIADCYTLYDTETGRVHKKEVVKVSKVNEGGAAYGNLVEDDVVNTITVDGKTYSVDRTFKLTDVMLNARVDSTVVFNITRGTQTLDVTMTLNEASIVEVP